MRIEIKNKIIATLKGKKILILGFGKEGQSTYRFLRKIFPKDILLLSDSNPQVFKNLDDPNILTFTGEDYLQAIHKADWVMKSPGISFKDIGDYENVVISSQTDLFIYLFSNQIIGITGTKGKSTTVSLIYHLLSYYFDDVKLVGNIGIPSLEIVGDITPDTKVVYELSSHQLEFSRYSPEISIILNLFEEHLDHYKSYSHYREAKWQIALHQKVDGYFIANLDDEMIQSDLVKQSIKSKLITISLNGNPEADFYFSGGDIWHRKQKLGFQIQKFKLLGKHNIHNLMAALAVLSLERVPIKEALCKAYNFKGLSHRLEFIGNFHGVDFVNDSIATIPQATLNALLAVENVQTLILGGFDRGISYDILIEFLLKYKPLHLILLGKVGQRLMNELELRNYCGTMKWLNCFDEAVFLAFKITEKSNSCLLSPAAASYDKFKNFEERGNRFKELVVNYRV